MATTADILGLNRPPTINRRWRRHYELLCAERDRLLARDELAVPVPTTPADGAVEPEADHAAGGNSADTAAVTKATIREVLDAIRRIERGTYGVCEITGQAIEPERLKAIPWTRCSYAGQDRLEKSMDAKRVQSKTEPAEVDTPELEEEVAA